MMLKLAHYSTFYINIKSERRDEMDNLVSKLAKLREETLEIDSEEKAYSILCSYKNMDIAAIKDGILEQLSSRYVSESIKDYLSWVLDIINNGLSKEAYDKSLDEIATIIVSRKSQIEGRILALFIKMINSNNPNYISFANLFISKADTVPLYNQVLDMDVLYRKLVSQQQSSEEDFSDPSRKNR